MTDQRVETIGILDSITLVLHSTKDGKLRVACTLWPDAKVLLPGQWFEAQTVDGPMR
jgi:hypothetical protein